jgi:hypothetical protein
VSRRRLPPDPERDAVLAELGWVARDLAARADAGDAAAGREMGYVLATMGSISLYGLDELGKLRARRFLRRAGGPGAHANGTAAG